MRIYKKCKTLFIFQLEKVKHEQFLAVILVLAGKSVITAIVRGFWAVVAQSELLWIHSVPQMALKED